MCFASFVLCCFKFLCSRAYKKISCLFFKRQEHTQILNGKDRVFCDTLTKTVDKNKGRPTSLPMKVSVDIVLTQYSVYV